MDDAMGNGEEPDGVAFDGPDDGLMTARAIGSAVARPMGVVDPEQSPIASMHP